MKSETSALDLFFIVKELQFLAGAKLEKIFQDKERKDELLLRFYVPEKGKSFLKIVIPKFIYLTQYKEDFENASGFARSLRRKIQSSKVSKIRQKDFDRILIIEFEVKKLGKTSNLSLVIELFGSGNIVLINEDNKILSLLHGQKLKDRSILPGKIYEFPSNQYNPLNSNKEEFSKILKQSDKNLVKALASSASLGGEFAEELCKICDLDKNKKISDYSEKELNNLFLELNKLSEIDLKGFIYEKSVTPFEFKTHSDLKSQEGSFCKALDEVLTERKQLTHESTIKNKSDSKIKKVENVLKKQKEMLAKIKSDSHDYQKKGEKIYEYYQQLSQLIEEITSLREKHSWTELKKIIKEKYPKIKINEKNNELVVDI